MEGRIAVSALPPPAKTRWDTGPPTRTGTAPVGESMPVASGGNEVANDMKTPPRQLPINIDQIAVGIPELNSPGNISAPNEMMLAIKIIEATKPAVTSLI